MKDVFGSSFGVFGLEFWKRIDFLEKIWGIEVIYRYMLFLGDFNSIFNIFNNDNVYCYCRDFYICLNIYRI